MGYRVPDQGVLVRLTLSASSDTDTVYGFGVKCTATWEGKSVEAVGESLVYALQRGKAAVLEALIDDEYAHHGGPPNIPNVIRFVHVISDPTLSYKSMVQRLEATRTPFEDAKAEDLVAAMQAAAKHVGFERPKCLGCGALDGLHLAECPRRG